MNNETAIAPQNDMQKIMDKTDLLKNLLPTVENPYKATLGGKQVMIYVASVTSDMAYDILEHSKMKNRATSKKNLQFIKSEMEGGKWKFTGDAIRFDEDGNLLDGKHRMTALSLTHKKSFEFLFIVGLEKSTFSVMDSGKKRTAGDVFSIKNVPNYDIAATAVKFVNALEEGYFRSNDSALNKGLTNADTYKKYTELKDFDEYIKKSKVLNKDTSRILSDPIVAGFYYMFSRVNINDAESFMESLITGVNLQKNSPIKIVRDRLLKSKLDVGARLKNIEKNRLVALAWKKHRRGEDMVKLIIPKNNDGLQILVKKDNIK